MCVCCLSPWIKKKTTKKWNISDGNNGRRTSSESHIAKSYGKALSMEMEKEAEPAKAITRKITIKRNGVDAFFLLDLKKKTHFVRFGWRAMTHTAVVKRDFAQNLFVDSFFPPE